MSTEKFEAWAIVELFGHQRCAGRISEALGGETFIRVDIPRAGADPFYTRLFGKGAIYCINICEEATARAFAGRMSEPLAPYTALPAPAPQTEKPGEIAGRYQSAASAATSGHDDDDDPFDDELDEAHTY
jgi:hypothetical protein